jgi:ABC-type lipoprotein release transport system permease subunit
MGSLLKISWRNIWRNRRRTLINMSAAGFGLFLIIVFTGLTDGIMADGKRSLANTGMGHVEIYAPGWRLQHKAGQALANPAALLASLPLPPGAQAGARVVARGLATSAHGGQGVQIHGVDPAVEARLANYAADLRQGGPLTADDAHGILVGEELAKRLQLRVGLKVRLMAQRADGEIGADLYRVRGIFHSISPNLSRGVVLVTSASAETLLGVGDVAHQIVIQLPRPDDADAVAAQLRTALGANYDIVTYGELLPLLKTMEATYKDIMIVMALFVYTLAGLGILNTMLMSVLERTREFGVMRALGNRPRYVVSLVLAEAFWIGTISAAAGLALGLLVTRLGSAQPLMDFGKTMGESFELGGMVLKTAFRTEFSPLAALKASMAIYLLTLAVGLYPAWRVSRMRPAEAIRAA